ncbi:MAG: 4Fe-4S binding protein, partial [Senegalia sp. (in: firmicutes)]|uniref:4Fe-4S binding protein n=1 Tax=Senegalia sp. (in: firmicutes) TaxID=1924098 RepID=UPI003F99052B
MRRFENYVQEIKYEVLREVSRLTINGELEEQIDNIPEVIDPGPEPRTRCCIHKERAITVERVRLALGGDKKNENVIEVLDEACEECPIDRFVVTEACRGCLAHRCTDVCPRNAIHFINHRAYIDQNKCIECGKCKNACPYNAISDVMRPCRRACNAGALSINENKKAEINNEKCIQCGACVYQCPFGAIMDKSYIVDTL